MSTELAQALVPLASMIVGGVIVHWSSSRLERQREKSEAKAVASMLAAEIAAIVEHARVRDYEGHYENFVRRFDAGDFSEMPGIRGLNDQLPDIAAANLGKLGLLGGGLSGDVVAWHSTLRGIKIDLIDVAANGVARDQCAPILKEVLHLWVTEVKDKAPELIKRLRSV